MRTVHLVFICIFPSWSMDFCGFDLSSLGFLETSF